MRKILHLILLILCAQQGFSQKTVGLNNTTHEHIFSGAEIEILEDASNKLTLNDLLTDQVSNKFHPNDGFYPTNTHLNSTYWYKLTVNYTQSLPENHAIIEFFDQTTDHISTYIPIATGNYIEKTAGATYKFSDRLFQHKNFEFALGNAPQGRQTYYFKVKSKNSVNVIIVYRRVEHFIFYALTEYFTYGIFYGMILIFCLHNLLMFMAVRRPSYFFYVLYILSVGFYEMSTDGIAYQYIWPNAPNFNAYAYGIFLYLISIFALLFTRELLRVKTQAYFLYRVINVVIILRTIFLLCCLFNHRLFIYKFVEFIPLSIAFITGIIIRSRGFKPARFFVLGYSFLFLGFILKVISVLGIAQNFSTLAGMLSFYSLGFSFILEMFFLSFAIGDQVRLLRREKEAATSETIRQMDINNKLKDSINQELEIKVQDRTKEVIEKSRKIFEQAGIIEVQNHELLQINDQLEKQAAKISLMNILLEKDNTELKHNIEKVTDARALSTELSFEEFSAKYPDQESCNKFLSDLKWADGFRCIKCANVTYHNGRAPHSRRCTKCGYEESVLFQTIFQNNRIPINKAFYIVYLMYTTKGTISSYQLSEKIGIRQSTCWQYAIRIKKVMDEHKKDGRKPDTQGWSKLVMERSKPSGGGKLRLSHEN